MQDIFRYQFVPFADVHGRKANASTTRFVAYDFTIIRTAWRTRDRAIINERKALREKETTNCEMNAWGRRLVRSKSAHLPHRHASATVSRCTAHRHRMCIRTRGRCDKIPVELLVKIDCVLSHRQIRLKRRCSSVARENRISY